MQSNFPLILAKTIDDLRFVFTGSMKFRTRVQLISFTSTIGPWVQLDMMQIESKKVLLLHPDWVGFTSKYPKVVFLVGTSWDSVYSGQ